VSLWQGQRVFNLRRKPKWNLNHLFLTWYQFNIDILCIHVLVVFKLLSRGLSPTFLSLVSFLLGMFIIIFPGRGGGGNYNYRYVKNELQSSTKIYPLNILIEACTVVWQPFYRMHKQWRVSENTWYFMQYLSFFCTSYTFLSLPIWRKCDYSHCPRHTLEKFNNIFYLYIYNYFCHFSAFLFSSCLKCLIDTC
jgi:hypothetical protein